MEHATPEVNTLQEHDKRSDDRTHWLGAKIDKINKEHSMSAEEKVIVHNKFEPGHGHSDGGGLNAMAAIAALGNRNDSRSNGPGYGDGGFGFGGGGGVGALLALALLGRRGFGDGDGGCNNNGERAVEAIQLSKLGSIEGAIPLAAANVTNNILQQTGQITGAIASQALGNQQGFANVKDTVQNLATVELAAIAGTKDAVQNGFFLTNTNLMEGLCAVKGVVVDQNEKTRAMLAARFQLEDQTKIASQAAEIIELRNEGRTRDLGARIEINNSAVAAQQQGQIQAQAQQQAQDINGLRFAVASLVGDIQAVRQGQVIFNSGTMAASGTQAAANTKVA